jgi:hypothetical protein
MASMDPSEIRFRLLVMCPRGQELKHPDQKKTKKDKGGIWTLYEFDPAELRPCKQLKSGRIYIPPLFLVLDASCY